jgi:hypothetical protein
MRIMGLGGALRGFAAPTRRSFVMSASLAAGLGILPAVAARAAVAGAVTRAAAFIIGDNLSLAALLYARGADKDMVDGLLAKCNGRAKDLAVELKPFPARSQTETQTTADVIHYLIAGDGWAIGTALVKRYGKDHGLLFEIAVKSNLLLLLYQPGDDSGIGAIIKSRCEEAKLPLPSWSPALAAIAAKKPYDDVREAVLKMHKDITAYLVGQAG